MLFAPGLVSCDFVLPAAQRRPEPSSRGILIVDDSDAILKMLALFFRSRGIPSWSATSGWAAVDIFEQCRAQIALVMLDVSMPELDGPHTYQELKRIDPALACLFMCGGWAPYSREDLLRLGARGLIAKPFSMDAVGAAVAELLNANDQRPASINLNYQGGQPCWC